LVSKLGHKTPTKANKLMDIATKFALGQEDVEAIFPQGQGPREADGRHPRGDHPTQPQEEQEEEGIVGQI
jgi:hypothetical protein